MFIRSKSMRVENMTNLTPSQKKITLKKLPKAGCGVHAFNPRAQEEAEAVGITELKANLVYEQVPGQLGVMV